MIFCSLLGFFLNAFRMAGMEPAVAACFDSMLAHMNLKETIEGNSFEDEWSICIQNDDRTGTRVGPLESSRASVLLDSLGLEDS